MSEAIVVKTAGLGKRFKIYAHPFDRAKEWLSRRQYHKEFWALRDVSFELKQGEILGILGPNGAGKSTLLQILTGILRPTTGAYQTSGQVLSLLELNTGFDPELTGRQNIFHSGQLLDLPSSYVKERLPEIEDFAELDEFFDRPLKLYSSGMRTRLGFSLFAFLDCSVLILDEILAVGDIFFKQKCYARMEELIKKNTSIIMVTHSTSVIQQYCHQAIVLNQGQVKFQGDPVEAVKHYLHLKHQQNNQRLLAMLTSMDDQNNLALADANTVGQTTDTFWPPPEAFLDLSQAAVGGQHLARCEGVAMCDQGGNACNVFEQGQWLCVYYEFELLHTIGLPLGRLTIANDKNVILHGKSTLQQLAAQKLPCASITDRLRFEQRIKLDIVPGEYTLKIGLATISPADYAQAEELSHHELESKITVIAHLDRLASFVVTPRTGDLALPHYGLCDLPGECSLTINGVSFRSNRRGEKASPDKETP